MEQAAQAAPPHSVVWRFAGAEFDEPRWQLRVAGVPVEIEPRPLEILLCLLRHAGEAVSREELLQAVWGHSHLSENALSNAVGKLRKALGDESQSIIATVHRVGYRLSVAVERGAAAAAPARPALTAGDPVAARPGWRLRHTLGAAATTEAWLATAEEGGGSRVFKFGHDGAGLARLKREVALHRHLEENLGEHPGLAKVTGWNFDSAPFFVECEDGGRPLPQWAQSQGGLEQVPLAVRLALIAQVADTVAAAHSVGVLHRVLDPDCILVDGDGQGGWRTRLIGFGHPGEAADTASIGAAPAQSGEEGPFGARDSTFYIAPEVLMGGPRTVRSDIYALGVILYQLIAGNLRESMAPGWEGRIADSLLRQDIAEAANGRPERRLATAGALAERLRGLERRRQEQFELRRQRLRSRTALLGLRRARQRRPWVMAVGLSLALGLAASMLFFQRSMRERDEALRQLARSEAVNSFLDHDLLAAADPNVGGAAGVTVLQAVHRAAEKIDTRFGTSPQVAVELHRTVGNAYRTLGNYGAAETEFRRAYAIALSRLGGNSVTTANCALQLAQLLAYRNRYEEAQFLIDDAGRIAQRDRSFDPMVAMRLWDARALLARHRTDLVAAAAASQRSLELLQQFRQSDPAGYEANIEQIFLMRLHIDDQFRDGGQPARAEGLERGLVADLTDRRGTRDPLTIRARRQLVASLVSEGRPEEAAALLPDLLRDASLTLGEDNRVYLAILRTQAQVLAQQRQWAAALDAARRAEAGASRLYGPQNDATVRAMLDTGRILAQCGRSDEAIGKLGGAYASAAAIQGPKGLLTGLAAYYLADAYLDAGRPATVRPLLDGLDAASLASAAPGQDWSARLSYQSGRYEIQTRNRDPAAAHLQKTRRIERFGPDEPPRAAIPVELDRAANPG